MRPNCKALSSCDSVLVIVVIKSTRWNNYVRKKHTWIVCLIVCSRCVQASKHLTRNNRLSRLQEKAYSFKHLMNECISSISFSPLSQTFFPFSTLSRLYNNKGNYSRQVQISNTADNEQACQQTNKRTNKRVLTSLP